MFSFLSSKTTRFFSAGRSYFSSRGTRASYFGAAICTTSASVVGFGLLLEDNESGGIDTKSVMGNLLPSTRKTFAEWNKSKSTETSKKGKDKDELFHGQVLKRQMHTPAVPYPLWDYNWDGKMTNDTSLEAFRSGRANASSTKQKKSDGSYQGSSSNRKGKTRHILLVRHGQYDERRQEDEYRKLTPLGRLQAIKTGKRLAEIANGSMNFPKPEFNGKCPIKAIHVSNMVRAKETAALIAEQFQTDKVVVTKPDPLLNEALPSPMIPIRPDIKGATEEIDENHDRIEEAFQKYFYRDESNVDEGEENDEFEIIVCHGNVIRYMFCRALQLPPETWLRMCTLNCSITYLTIRPNGMVSARMMGDIGHLDYDESSFSGYNGFKW